MNTAIKAYRFFNDKIPFLLAFSAVMAILPSTVMAQDSHKKTSENQCFTEKMTFLSRPPQNSNIYFESGTGNDTLTKVAYVALSEDGMRVVANKNIGKLYDHIAKGYPIIAPQTDTVGFLADKDGDHYAVIGGEESPAYDGVCRLAFSPNGKYSAYIAQKEGRQFVVLNGHPLKKYDMIDQKAGVLFSPDSEHTAYIAAGKGKKDKRNRMRVIKDGKEHPLFDDIPEIAFSPDSRELAYIGVKDKSYYIVRGKQSSGPYDIVKNLLWSPDGDHLAAVAIANGRRYVIKDGKKNDAGEYNIKTVFNQKTNEYRSLVPHLPPPTFSPDSKKFAYIKADEMRHRAVVNGKSGPAFDTISKVRFSPDSTHFVYSAAKQVSKEKQWLIVYDGDPGRAYQAIGEPVFSPDSKHLAYRARKENKWCIVSDQAEGRLSEGKLYDGVAPPFFSPDGSTLVYRAQKNGQYCIVKNGEEQPLYDEISHLNFSPDSSQMAYLAQKGDAWLIVRNKKEGKHYKTVPPKIFHPVSPPVFSPRGNHLVYSARTGNTLKETKIVVDEQEGDCSFLALPRLSTPIIFDSETHCYALVGQVENDVTCIYHLEISITN